MVATEEVAEVNVEVAEAAGSAAERPSANTTAELGFKEHLEAAETRLSRFVLSFRRMIPAAQLLSWYDKHGRDLPWRKTRDPYKILVSEIMLQQTQVRRVLVFFEKWLKKFPNWQSLAKASNEDVIKMWAGLGYNRRALALRDIARQIVERGEPKTEAGWLELKGIGPYTSAAIAAFALKQRTIPIDTNIRRTLGRLLLGIPYPTPEHDERIRRAADAFLPRHGRFYDVPQALFDLATAICTKAPSCADCPMRSVCPAAPKFLSGRVKAPKAMTKKSVERKHRNKPHPDRIYRGRILKLVRESGSIAIKSIGPRIDPRFDPRHDRLWLRSMIDRLASDHLIIRRGTHLSLFPEYERTFQRPSLRRRA
jgi:A/G-specific adenine glycosylase